MINTCPSIYAQSHSNDSIEQPTSISDTSKTSLPTTQRLVPTQHEMQVFQVMADQAAQSKLYTGIGSAAVIMTTMLAARELGLPPMLALNGGLHFINGKMEISARAMNAMIRRAGHSIREITATATKCELKGIRTDGDTMTASYTIEEARQAGLIKSGGGWSKAPADMLFARALSRLARRLFPDVIGTAYVEGEICQPRGCNGPSFRDSDEEPDPELPDCVDVEMVSDVLTDFLARFDPSEAELWAEYLHVIKERQGLSFEQIIEKMEADPVAAREKFAKWKEKRSGG